MEVDDQTAARDILSEKQEKLPAYVPGPEAVDITPDKDGGVLKEIRRHGTGDSHPLTGDKVFVHYVGTLLDGTKFDSSRDRGEQFEFSIGTGAVIKAWDLGVATMKRGELAVLLCRSEYAYGQSGSPPSIPPDATLVFEVELFDWKGEDVSEDKDGGILKSQIKKGEGYATPKEGASCEIHIVGRHDGRTFDDRDVSFVLGEGLEVGIVDGVEQGLQKMKKGEHARLLVKSKYAYRAEGSVQHNIPPNADLEYEVEMKKFEKSKESWEMETGEKLEQCEISKSKGTEFFKANKFSLAIRYYKKILDYLKSEESLQGEEADKKKSLLLAAHLNLAMCYLKLKEDFQACKSCDEALQLDPKNEKGLFRRGTANLNLQNFDVALEDFKAVLEIDPENKAAKNQITVTNQKKKQVHEREKQMYSGMFKKLAATEPKKSDLEEAKSDKKDSATKNENGDSDGSPTAEA